MEMYFCPLFSGSSGNALFCQYGETRLLIDAGKSGKTIEDALASIGAEIRTLNGVLVTHEHSDHIYGIGVMARKYGEQSFKEGESQDLSEEMADVLWVLICLANQTGVDLTAALEASIEKKTKRDKDRHQNNTKLK